MYQYSFALVAARDLTDIAVNEKLNVGVVGPYDSIYGGSDVLKKKPETQECGAEIPSLPHEAS